MANELAEKKAMQMAGPKAETKASESERLQKNVSIGLVQREQ